jgi:hypothetical protein
MQAAELEAYVHVGPRKTGSTHIQNFLQPNAAKLAQENFHWPHHENNQSFNAKD